MAAQATIKRSNSAIAVTSDGAFCLVANPDPNSLSIAATLYEAVTRPSSGSEHDVSSLLTEAEIQDLIAFMLALPFVE